MTPHEFIAKWRAAKLSERRACQHPESPPPLLVRATDRIEIHPNFTATAKKVYAFDLDGLADPENLSILRRVFSDPASLKPGETTASITEDAAKRFAAIADGMRA